MKKLTTRQIALNGVAAGLYAAITILTASFAYGNIQFRIADALCVLVVLEPSLTVGLTLGCLISNIFSTVSALDIVIGTAGTLLGCLLAARVKKDWLVPVPIMLANAVLVGAMLAYVLTPTALVQGFFINGGEVLLGEAVVLYLLGVPLLVFFRKNGCYALLSAIPLSTRTIPDIRLVSTPAKLERGACIEPSIFATSSSLEGMVASASTPFLST